MGYERIASLSPQQIACLRKVMEHKDSTVIAHELGIAKNTVDVHIAKALTKLQLSTRREAAALLLNYDRATNDSTITDFVGMDAATISDDRLVTPKRTGSTLRDTEMNGDLMFIPPLTTDLKLSNEPNRNDLNTIRTIGLCIVIVIGLLSAVILATAASNSVQDVANFFRSPAQH